MSACRSPGAGRWPSPSTHTAPDVAEHQSFPKDGWKKRKAGRLGKRSDLDAASPLLVPSPLSPVHCTRCARLVPGSVSPHEFGSASLTACVTSRGAAGLPMLPPGQADGTVPHSSDGAAGPAQARLCPMWYCQAGPSHRHRNSHVPTCTAVLGRWACLEVGLRRTWLACQGVKLQVTWVPSHISAFQLHPSLRLMAGMALAAQPSVGKTQFFLCCREAPKRV